MDITPKHRYIKCIIKGQRGYLVKADEQDKLQVANLHHVNVTEVPGPIEESNLYDERDPLEIKSPFDNLSKITTIKKENEILNVPSEEENYNMMGTNSLKADKLERRNGSDLINVIEQKNNVEMDADSADFYYMHLLAAEANGNHLSNDLLTSYNKSNDCNKADEIIEEKNKHILQLEQKVKEQEKQISQLKKLIVHMNNIILKLKKQNGRN